MDAHASGTSIMLMSSMRPWPAPFARLAVIFTSLMLLLAVFNVFANTDSVGSWLPLFVMMPWLLYLGVWSLRNLDRT